MRVRRTDRLAAVRAGRALGALRRPPVPDSEARLRGGLHSLRRDRDAIRHHYDVSNAFYRLVLGPSMVYSCAYFASPDDSLEQAQARKLDVICRKLRLREGDRLLDGPYDKLASVGMYEHVGAEQLDEYMRRASALLRPGGLFLNHGIVRADARGRDPKTFVTRYVFPDGELHASRP